MGDDLVGEIASSGGIKIDENFLNQFDKDGDGRFDLGLYIFSNGKKVKNKRSGDKGGESIVRFRFELIKSPGYELRRVGSSGAGQFTHSAPPGPYGYDAGQSTHSAPP